MSAGVPYDYAVAPDNAALAALLFELASQLHVERARRIALELALERGSPPTPAVLDGLASDPEFRRRSQQALDESMARLMGVITDEDRS
ncbi:MAG: hypothetical protein CMLOHMNK_00956 [Steroidobacteraceae bacterium]|nr:hypothetical protein [Steroidobacteraceae bacterium]